MGVVPTSVDPKGTVVPSLPNVGVTNALKSIESTVSTDSK
jgi:hypothetical protein